MSWAPSYRVDRRKDHSRARERAQRLRRELTASEARLWKMLQTFNRAGYSHFRKQTQVGDFVYDFADLSRRLLIELDGGIHDLPDVVARDAIKAQAAEQRGYRLLRIKNKDVWGAADSVADQVREALNLSQAERLALRRRRRKATIPPPNGGRAGRGGAPPATTLTEEKAPTQSTP